MLKNDVETLNHEKQCAERERDRQTERAKALLCQKTCFARKISKLRDKNSQLKTVHAQKIAAVYASHAQECNASQERG